MDTKALRRLFEGRDKKKLTQIAILFAIGVGLLALSAVLGSGGSGGGSEESAGTTQGSTQSTSQTGETYADFSADYALDLEERLSAKLSLVAGAGRVEVMVTLGRAAEKVPARETSLSESATYETDSQGGARDTSSGTSSESYVVISQKDGTQEALILTEEAPVVEGVIVIAEGGGDIAVKDALTRAAYTVLGIESHRVQVLQMENQE